jgi:hypothetical protein
MQVSMQVSIKAVRSLLFWQPVSGIDFCALSVLTDLKFSDRDAKNSDSRPIFAYHHLILRK